MIASVEEFDVVRTTIRCCVGCFDGRVPERPAGSRSSMSGVGRRAVLAALAANLGVALTKLVGFVFTGSASLMAETFHSVADSGNQALLLLGSKRAQEAPSPVHPFGRGRERYFWAFIVGLVLFGLGGVFSIYEGTRKLIAGTHELSNPVVAVVLLGVAAVIEALSLRTAVAEANQIRPPGQRWSAFLRRTRNPDVTVVLLEDGAAMLGLLIASVGVTASWITGQPVWDGVASVMLGVLLCGVASFLTAEMKSLLIGETVSAGTGADLEDAIGEVDGVQRVLNLRTEHLGPDDVLVCVKIALDEPADLQRVIAVIEAVERRVTDVVPETLTCYVEPDIFDPMRAGGTWT